jgi:hypothetical protein
VPELLLDKPEVLSTSQEIGCGDGTHSIFWRQTLDGLGLESVRVFGVDLFEPLIY